MSRARTLSLVLALAFATLAGACTTAAEPTSTSAVATIPAGPLTTTSVPPTSSATPPTVAALTPDPIEAPDGLAVLGVDGVISVARDGRLVAISDPTLIATQPSWAPDGVGLAWVEFDTAGQAGIGIMVGPGEPSRHVPIPFGAFYLLWSPDGHRLAFLGNNPVTLGLVDVAAGTAEVLDAGTPYYFDWAPTSDRLVTHIGGAGIAVGQPGRPTEILAPASVAFLAPEWTADGSAVLYVTGGPDDGLSAAAGNQPIAQPAMRTLVLRDITSGDLTEVVEFSGRISFSISPDGRRIAYSVTTGGEPLNFGPLVTVDLDGRDAVTISPRDVVAFEWAPDSRRLAFLSPSDDQTALQWAVGDGDTVVLFDPIVPSTTYLQSYLPFFDQYARGMTRWASDSSAIAVTVSTPAGDQIWLQPAGGGSPGLVGPGAMAVFAPSGS
jgi:TolB protein